MKPHTWKPYVAWVLFTEGVGGLSGWLTRDGARIYSQAIAKPPLSPPAIVFPIAWGILFFLMGIGAARVWMARPGAARTQALAVFLLQLGFNFLWSILFFQFQAFGVALAWLAALWGLIIWMILAFHKVDAVAAWLQFAYLLWVSFAAWLNFGVWVLNR